MTTRKNPSLKAEWKNAMRALDRLDADINARAVYTALWAYTDTNLVNTGDVVPVYPKVSTIRDLIGVRSDKTITKALNWLVEQGVIWRARPPRLAKLQGRLTLGGVELHRGVCVYAFIERALPAKRAMWAQDADRRGIKLEGGRTLQAALAVDVKALEGRIAAARKEAINVGVNVAMEGGTQHQIQARVQRSLEASRSGVDAMTLEALSRLGVAALVAEVQAIMATAPKPSRTARAAAR